MGAFTRRALLSVILVALLAVMAFTLVARAGASSNGAVGGWRRRRRRPRRRDRDPAVECVQTEM